MLEFPAGKLEPGEAPLDLRACANSPKKPATARRSGRAPRYLHNAIAYSNEGIEIWFARGLSLGERHLDDGEFLDVVICTPEELETLARRGELTDAKTLVGLMWLQNWRAGRWALRLAARARVAPALIIGR